MCRRWNECVLAVSLVTILGAMAAAASKENGPADAKSTFLRLSRDDCDQPISMETAIVHYKRKRPTSTT